MDEISPDELYEGLLAEGLFGDKLPPFFSSRQFYEYCISKQHSFEDVQHGYITYRVAKNNNTSREFGIPNPFAYERLVGHIRDYWNEYRAVLKTNTEGDPFRVSRIHIRKKRGSSALFEMNYKNWRVDANPLPKILLGKRYVVKTDISKCFPSIYTHAIDWALSGKINAKANRRNKKRWEHELDHFLMRTTNDETHGILIGPHA